MKLTEEQCRQYGDAGFMVFDGILEQAVLDQIKSNLKELAVPGSPGVVLEKNGLIRALHGCHLVNDFFERLTRHPLLLEPAMQILGSSVYVHQVKINIKAAFGGDIWPWHQDFIFWHREDGMPEPKVVNIGIFIDRVSPYNGPLFFIPGSHKHGMIDVAANTESPEGWRANVSAKLKYTVPQDTVARLEQDGGMEAAVGEAGSVLIFHPNMVHGSVPNISPYDRELLLITYNSTENRPIFPPKPRPDFLASKVFTPLAPLKDGELVAMSAC